MNCDKMTKYYLDQEGLKYFWKKVKTYIDIKTELAEKKQVNCPNCGAPITDTKCPYCGTSFDLVF